MPVQNSPRIWNWGCLAGFAVDDAYILVSPRWADKNKNILTILSDLLP